jgi:23S rRNA pseudouridine2605 synthase
MDGIVIGSERLGAADATLRKRSRRESHLTLTLVEGRNREVRRLLAALGHEVTRLTRVQLGGLTLGGMQPGEWRDVARAELYGALPGAPLPVRGPAV